MAAMYRRRKARCNKKLISRSVQKKKMCREKSLQSLFESYCRSSQEKLSTITRQTSVEVRDSPLEIKKKHLLGTEDRDSHRRRKEVASAGSPAEWPLTASSPCSSALHQEKKIEIKNASWDSKSRRKDSKEYQESADFRQRRRWTGPRKGVRGGRGEVGEVAW